ncbi:hypothetical protein [Streptomyces hydrogenans]
MPVDGSFFTSYATAVNREAAHPASMFQQEYLFDDEAQNLRLAGYARVVPMEPMEQRGDPGRDSGGLAAQDPASAAGPPDA